MSHVDRLRKRLGGRRLTFVRGDLIRHGHVREVEIRHDGKLVVRCSWTDPSPDGSVHDELVTTTGHKDPVEDAEGTITIPFHPHGELRLIPAARL